MVRGRLTNSNRKNKVKKNEHQRSAGKHWFYSLMDRHPELSIQKSDGMSVHTKDED